MSHFTRLQTRLVDAGALVKALADMGFAHVEVHDQPQHLFGYRGDRRPETAEVIVRRKYIGPTSASSASPTAPSPPSSPGLTAASIPPSGSPG
jgi:hypothetical protein